MKHFHKPLWNRDSEALKSSWGLPACMKGVGTLLSHWHEGLEAFDWVTPAGRGTERTQTSALSRVPIPLARDLRGSSWTSLCLWEAREFPTPLFSLLSQPRTFPVNNSIKKLSVDLWRRKGRDNNAQRFEPHMRLAFPFRVIWRHMTSSLTPQESRESGFSNTFGEPQIVFQLAHHASSLQVPGPDPSHSSCSHGCSAVVKTENPTLGGRGSNLNPVTSCCNQGHGYIPLLLGTPCKSEHLPLHGLVWRLSEMGPVVSDRIQFAKETI